jgi:diguanylate cyclase (GGDEF)-like protein
VAGKGLSRLALPSAVLGLGFLVAATAAATTLSWSAPTHWPILAAVLVVAYALCSRVALEIGPGFAVPTQLVFVPMWFVVPSALLPLAVAAGYLLGAIPEYLGGSMPWRRSLALLGRCWYAFGPALVLSQFAHGEPSLRRWPVLVGAFAAQVAFDGLSLWARESPQRLMPFLAWAYGLDALLTPAGISAATNGPAGFLLVLPIAALLAVLAWNARVRLERSLSANEASYAEAQLARSDMLTGVGNQLAWDEALQLLQHDLRAAGKPHSIVLVDVGHLSDELLQAVAATLREALRGDDVVARIGGDEFAILMRDTDAGACVVRLERLERALAERYLPSGVRVAATVGHGSIPPAASLRAAQEAAKARLYEAKAANRELSHLALVDRAEDLAQLG